MSEIKIKINDEMKQGDFIQKISRLINDMKYKGYYGPYLIISDLEVELKAELSLYTQFAISEYQRIVEKREILDWNGWKYSNELDEARTLEEGILILRQCSKEDLRQFRKNKIEVEVKEIKEKLDKIIKQIDLL